jgi:hypothetical protein
LQSGAFKPPPNKFIVVPAHTGELLLAVAVGKALTITEVVAMAVQPFALVMIN